MKTLRQVWNEFRPQEKVPPELNQLAESFFFSGALAMHNLIKRGFLDLPPEAAAQQMNQLGNETAFEIIKMYGDITSRAPAQSRPESPGQKSYGDVAANRREALGA